MLVSVTFRLTSLRCLTPRGKGAAGVFLPSSTVAPPSRKLLLQPPRAHNTEMGGLRSQPEFAEVLEAAASAGGVGLRAIGLWTWPIAPSLASCPSLLSLPSMGQTEGARRLEISSFVVAVQSPRQREGRWRDGGTSREL